jgi:hypothetical protein
MAVGEKVLTGERAEAAARVSSTCPAGRRIGSADGWALVGEAERERAACVGGGPVERRG